MNSPLSRLKVPYGLYKQANEKGLLKVVFFYYRLKSLKIDGCFSENDFNQFCCDNLYVSYNTAKKYKKLLIENQFAYIKDHHLYLVRYDSLWNKLGIDLSTLKLMRVSPKDFENEIITNEIGRNLFLQKKELKKKYLKQELKTDIVKNANRSLKKALLSQLDCVKTNLERQINSIRQKITSFSDVNYQITLTCKKIAEIFGLKSATQGHRIVKTMVSIGKIKSTNQGVILVAKGIKKQIINSLNLDSSFFVARNCLFKQLPNIVEIV